MWREEGVQWAGLVCGSSAGRRQRRRARLDGESFQAVCVDGFVASWTARGFSPVTIENGMGVLERFLDLLAVPAWEAGPEDVDRVVGELVARGAAASTRRGYVQAFKDFHRFLVARKAAEIEATFGVVLEDPVDEFNAARHVGNDSVSTRPPPTPERMDEFFAFLRERVATARKYAPAGRDYALFRTLYHCGLRAVEAASLRGPICILIGGRSARSTFGSARALAGRARDRGGCRCWTSSTWCCAGISTMSGRGWLTRRRCFVTRAAACCIGARSATGCAACSNSRTGPTLNGSRLMVCVTRARPTTTNAASTWWPSNRCWGTGMWERRCVT